MTTTDTQLTNSNESYDDEHYEGSSGFSAMLCKLVAFVVILVSLFTMVKPIGALLRSLTKAHETIDNGALYSSIGVSVLGLLLACILLQLTYIAERLNKPNA